MPSLRTMSSSFLFALAVACAATNNPTVGENRPLPPPEAPKAQAPAQNPAPQKPAPAPAATPAKPDAPAAKPQAPAQPASDPLVLGIVGDRPIEVREFMMRLWMRDQRTARETLEQIVFARLAMNEADRLGVQLEPARVDEVVNKALGGLEKKLADSGSKLTVDQHIRENLDMEPEYYKARLREDAIVQLLAERCVRAWVGENERSDVRLTEVRDESALPKIRAALDGGKSFADIALEFGAGDDAATHTTTMTIIRAENQELSRAAFATTVGQVCGPIAQTGRWLFMLVESRHQPETGTWAQIGPHIEESLKASKVDDLEYVQWRAAMVRRYKVDLTPFLDVVGETNPAKPSK